MAEQSYSIITPGETRAFGRILQACDQTEVGVNIVASISGAFFEEHGKLCCPCHEQILCSCSFSLGGHSASSKVLFSTLGTNWVEICGFAMTVSASEHMTQLIQLTAEGDSISEPTKSPLSPSNPEQGNGEWAIKRLRFAHSTSADQTHLAVELWADIGEGIFVKVAESLTERIVVCGRTLAHGQNKASISSMSSIDLGTLTISGEVQTEGSMLLTKEDQKELIDMVHHFFLILRGGYLFEVAIYSEHPKVVDLGAGTGIWAVHVAELGAEVHAVESGRLQPENLNPNVRVHFADIELPDDELWSQLDQSHFVHVRDPFGTVKDTSWSGIYQRAFKCLLPDGYIQQVQIDWTPQGVNSNCAIKAWSEEFLRGSERLGRSVRVQPSKTRQLMEMAGFTNIVERVIPCHLVPQMEQSDFDSQDTEEYRLSYMAPNWLNVIFQRFLTALSWEPMSEGLGMSESSIRQQCQDAKKESLKSDCPVRINVYYWLGFKPRDT